MVKITRLASIIAAAAAVLTVRTALAAPAAGRRPSV